ncbi:SDR family oxidoreductase [Compostibacter hankyongensis]|uniref:SDR family oxidoreductase n=1 Tax=Compostibacter hankyongensis TaxID=1007089 RepID=A0ABP8FCY1_9BACT
MTRVLVAGATGYLGSHLCRELKKQHYFIRALARNTKKLQQLHIPADEVFKGEATGPATLSGCCAGIDVVISTLGITRQKDGLTYMDVDYQANMNLLREAQQGGVKKFVFIFIANAERLQHLKMIRAKQKFATALKSSGLDYCIIQPNGFFADMREFLTMAEKGRIYLFGKGNFRINPIHGADLAEACISALEKNEKEIAIGGPQILTHREIAEMAFAALNKKAAITCIPVWVKTIALGLLHTFTSVKIYGPVEFLLTVLTMDMLAPPYGSRTLDEFFREAAAGDA